MGIAYIKRHSISEFAKGIFSLFSKLLGIVCTPIAHRFADWIGRRKPRLHVHVNPAQCVWGLGGEIQSDGAILKLMQVTFWADFSHDDPTETLIILSAFPKDTEQRFGLITKITVPPYTLIKRQQIAVMVLPIKGEVGKSWRGRFVLTDQHERQYKTKPITFRWVG